MNLRKSGNFVAYRVICGFWVVAGDLTDSMILGRNAQDAVSDGVAYGNFRYEVFRKKMISYIFLGSRHHMLRRMFSDRNRPFYRSAIVMMLDKPPFGESVDFVVSRFASCGYSIPRDVAEQLVAKVDNIPYYVRQLGFEVFRLIEDEGRKKATNEDLASAYRLLSGFNRDQYEQQMLNFSVAQKKLLIALAHERTREFDDAYRVRYRLGASSTVNSTKKKLMEDGHIEQSDGKYCVADPFFARYLSN